ncbi:MAG TPA: hypothetical protein VK871_11960 [Candidatus Limnocylindrales bacterium]|nr:hypothetical protein [Candidatus Limnocylindrales bacterium]
MLDRESPEGPLELLAVGDGRSRVRGSRLDREELDGGLEPASTTELVGGRVDEDAVEPAVEAVDVPELRQLAPATDERLLDRVFGEVVVPQDEPSDRQEAIDLTGRKPPEGVSVAVPRSLDEISPHLCRRRRAGRTTGS